MHHGPQHGAPAHSQQITDHARELNPAFFQQPFHLIAEAHLLGAHPHPQPCHRPPLSLLPIRHVAQRQIFGQQPSHNAGRIGEIGLADTRRQRGPRLRQVQPKPPFQRQPYRPPILGRRLHGDLAHLLLTQPFAQPFQFPIAGPELPLLVLDLLFPQHRHHYRQHSLMYVNASHRAVYWIHSISFASHSRVLSPLPSPRRTERTIIATSPRSRAKHSYRLTCSSADRASPLYHSIPFSSLSVGDAPIPTLLPV